MGDGTFGSQRTFGVGSFPFHLATGDFDADGHEDLAVVNRGIPNAPGNTVSVLRGDGMGAFSDRRDFAVGEGPLSATVADVNGDGFEDIAVSNFDGDTVSLLVNAAISADLSLKKEASPDPGLEGGKITYKLTATNGGPDAALDAGIEDILPEGVDFVSASSGCAESGGMVACEAGDIPSGESRGVEIVVRPIGPGEFTNTATVHSRTPDPDPENSSAEATTTVRPVVDVEISMTASEESVERGDELSWTVDVKNNGPSTSTGGEVVSELPPNVEILILNGICSFTGEEESGQTVTCSAGGPLASGGSRTVAVITVRVLGSEDLTNTATVSAAESDTDESNNVATTLTKFVEAAPPPADPTDTSLTLATARSLIVFPQSVGLGGGLVDDGGRAIPNAEIIIERRLAGEGEFRRVGAARTNGSGVFSARVSPPSNAVFRARFMGDGENRPSASAVGVNVRALVNLRLSRSVARPGQGVVVAGAVRPVKTSFAVLTIRRGGKVVVSRRVGLDGQGRYRFVYRVPARGNYLVQVRFPGDRDNVANASSRRFHATPPPRGGGQNVKILRPGAAQTGRCGNEKS